MGRINISELDKESQDYLNDNYNFNVVESDSNGRPIHITYKRLDGTLFKDATCSNPDVNGFYQTVTEKTYAIDGITLKHTKTQTIAYNAKGVITSRQVVND